MKKYNVCINIEDSNKNYKSLLFHTNSRDVRPEQVLALLDAMNKIVRTELIETTELDTCEFYKNGKCSASKGFVHIDCKGIKDNCIYI